MEESAPRPCTAAGSLLEKPLVNLFVYMAKKRLSGDLRLITPENESYTVRFRSGCPLSVQGLPGNWSEIVEVEGAISELFHRVNDGTSFEFYAAPTPTNEEAQDIRAQPLSILWHAMRAMPQQAYVDLHIQERMHQPFTFSQKVPIGSFGFDRMEILTLDHFRLPDADLESFFSRTRLPVELAKRLVYLLSVTGCLPVLVTRPAEIRHNSYGIPSTAPSMRLMVHSPQQTRPSQTPAALQWQATGIAKYKYLAFTLSLVPLAFSLLGANADLSDRIERTLAMHPEITQGRTGRMSIAELLTLLPDNRLDGALLSRESHAHWLFAAISSMVMLLAILWLFEAGTAKTRTLAKVGLFTATLGMIVLFAVQIIASATQYVWLRGTSIFVIFFYILKFIGYSYRAALDPSNGFFPSLVGFTFGVGLCEELVKFLPLIWYYRNRKDLDWRATSVWGMASGVGFGVSEAVSYSSQFYNGLCAGDAYLVRFVSCVALHAVWSGTAALIGYGRRDDFRGARNWRDWSLLLITVVSVPMWLHGLYDTLLKREMHGIALIVALVSVGVFSFTIERNRRRDEKIREALANPA
jgi:RsiW-degrading membrane proteinase PrsW (M82 family)